MNNKSLLNQFEESGKEVYQVTKNEWVSIMQDHYINACQRPLEEFIKCTKQEVECFHNQEVRNAVEKGIEVSEEILKDYAGLKEQVQKELNKINSIPVFTNELLNTLHIGDKIKVDGYKMTVHELKENQATFRAYKKRNKGVIVNVGNRMTLEYGW